MADESNWLREPIGEADGAWRAEGPTVVAQSGRTIRFGPEQFKHRICFDSNNCFLCGLPENEAVGREFTKEHVIPKWVLTMFDLHKRKVLQPDGTPTRYGQYHIDCCEPCNQLLNARLEDGLSKTFHGGYQAVANKLAAEGESFERKLFVWLSLIYIKKYLKDARLPRHRDSRQGTQTKAEALGHDWDEFFAIYNIARSPLTGAHIDRSAFGTLLVLPADSTEQVEPYAYIDDRDMKVMFVRLGDVALLSVLNDGQTLRPELEAITSALDPPYTHQVLLELLGQAGYWTARRQYAPVYFDETHFGQRTYRIFATLPPVRSFVRSDSMMLQQMIADVRDKGGCKLGVDLAESLDLGVAGLQPDETTSVAPEDDPRHPVVVIRHGQDGLPIDAPPCALLGPGALNEDEAVQLVKEEGFTVLSEPIAPRIPAAELSHSYSRSRDAIAVRVFDEPKFLYTRGNHPDMPFDVIVNLDPRNELAQPPHPRGKH